MGPWASPAWFRWASYKTLKQFEIISNVKMASISQTCVISWSKSFQGLKRLLSPNIYFLTKQQTEAAETFLHDCSSFGRGSGPLLWNCTHFGDARFFISILFPVFSVSNLLGIIWCLVSAKSLVNIFLCPNWSATWQLWPVSQTRLWPKIEAKQNICTVYQTPKILWNFFGVSISSPWSPIGEITCGYCVFFKLKNCVV